MRLSLFGSLPRRLPFAANYRSSHSASSGPLIQCRVRSEGASDRRPALIARAGGPSLPVKGTGYVSWTMSAFQVFAPTMPSCVSLNLFWKDMTAFSVPLPNVPLTIRLLKPYAK